MFQVVIVHTVWLCFRLTRGELNYALRHSFNGPGSDSLSNEYEEFFLNNADDITELLKRSQRSSAHFQAQQMSCDMVQVRLLCHMHLVSSIKLACCAEIPLC